MNLLSVACSLSEFIMFSRKNAENTAHFLPFSGPLTDISNMHNPQYNVHNAKHVKSPKMLTTSKTVKP